MMVQSDFHLYYYTYSGHLTYDHLHNYEAPLRGVPEVPSLYSLLNLPRRVTEPSHTLEVYCASCAISL